jgi:DNA-binding NtrC family response regulator
MRNTRYDAVITDLYMPEIDGMAFLGEVNRLYPGLPVVMITAFGTVDSAVDAIKKGAFDYVTKPFEQSEIVSVVQKAVSTSRLKSLEIQSTEAENALEESMTPLLHGHGAAMLAVQATVQKVAASPSTVLLYGEPGSGKELLAEEIHARSDRTFQGMLKINCAAVSSMLLETELFGGAKPGKLELAHKGTLFLDEISELNTELQLKLLSFLETGVVEHPTNFEKKKFDVRLIVATHKDLQREVREGRFREDLFYKINVVPIHLPPLRERKDDLPEIVSFFVRRLNQKLHKHFSVPDGAVMQVFSAVSWPGNLRQLEHVLERMMVLAEGKTLREQDIPADVRMEMDTSGNYDSSNFRDIIRRQTQNLEKDLIEKALSEMDGNVTRTAEHLGISRKGLQLKMKELGIK